MSDPADELIRPLLRLEGWGLLVLGAALGVVLPWPVTTAVWTAACRAFLRGGDTAMAQRLLSTAKFGPAIARNLRRSPPRRLGGPCQV